ncbi:MAG: type I methionyl aminopeptidase [Planctomycetes bacterium]|nr:type I methionyl aminopeptidase [Planctomycetota bacterium]
MIQYKSLQEIELMRSAGRIVADVIKMLEKLVRPEMTTLALDEAADKFIRDNDAEPAFKGYRGYPANICVSVNEEVVHGIPGARRLKDGDIVSIDIGVHCKNYYADAAVTLPVGKISKEAQRLIEVTRRALENAIDKIYPGAKLSEISGTVQQTVEKEGFSVVRDFVGHGIGQVMHEDPQIPNYLMDTDDYTEVVLKPGMVLAIEPMVNLGTYAVETLSNGWTVVTKDRRLSAHFEHTIAVMENGNQVLTIP